MEPRASAPWSLTRAIFRLIVIAIVGTALAFVAAPFFAFRAVKAAAAPNRARFAAAPRRAKSGESAVIFAFERRDLFAWTLVQIHLPDAP